MPGPQLNTLDCEKNTERSNEQKRRSGAKSVIKNENKDELGKERIGRGTKTGARI